MSRLCRWIVGLWMISFASQAIELEMWSALDAQTSEPIAEQLAAQTPHSLNIRHFYIDNIRSELLVANQSGGATPDALYVPSDLLGLYAFLSFSTVPEPWLDIDTFENKSLDLIQVDGQYYGVPLALGNHLVLYVNADKAAVKNPSWEYLFEQAAQGASPIAMQYPNSYFFMAFTSLFSEQKMALATDVKLDALAKTLTFYRDLVEKQVLVDGCDQACARAKFIAGESDYLIDGDWALNEIKKSMQDHFTITALPRYQGRVMRSLSGGKVLAFTKQAMSDPNKRPALEAMARLVQRAQYVDQVIIGQNLISSKSKINQLSFYSHATYYTQLYNQLTPAIIMPSTVKMAVFWEGLTQGIRRYEQGMPAEASAQFILDYVERHTDKIQLSVPQHLARAIR